jgi:acetoacetyl-CoA reductase
MLMFLYTDLTFSLSVNGVVMTPLIETLGAQAMEDVLTPKVALRRVAQPDDIARVIVFLMSEEAGYISGTASTPSRTLPFLLQW